MTNETTIKQIINVNYAGEYGAIRLYKAMILVANVFHKPLLTTLQTILSDEQKHCDIFRSIMPKYNMVPCRLTWIWGVAGFFLGIGTALLGKRSLLICVKAAENTAHSHLQAQSKFLANKDNDLTQIINDVHIEEHKHVELSEEGLKKGKRHFYEPFLYKAIYQICQATMWLVTKGESSNMRKTLIIYRNS
ncbi:MAG: demethoxyubiquinone hydroxylase family protein [Rickettsiales bacterium]